MAYAQCMVIANAFQIMISHRGFVFELARRQDMCRCRCTALSLLAHFSQEAIVKWHMLNTCSLPMRFKWWFLIHDLFFDLSGSRTCADVAAQLYWVTCLLVNFSKEGTVTQHMQGTWLMPRYCKCWMLIRKNMLNARGSVKSSDIAARR